VSFAGSESTCSRVQVVGRVFFEDCLFVSFHSLAYTLIIISRRQLVLNVLCSYVYIVEEFKFANADLKASLKVEHF
jgi:hypothetical protein